MSTNLQRLVGAVALLLGSVSPLVAELPAASASTPDISSQALLQHDATILDSNAANVFGPDYSGYTLDEAANRVTLLATRGPTAAETERLDRLGAGSPAFRLVPFSLVQLSDASSTLLSSRSSLAGEGVNLVEVGIDPLNNRLIVGIDPTSTSNAESAISQRLGDIPFHMVRVRLISTASDYGNVPPYYGGIELDYSYVQNATVFGEACTAGFNLEPVGTAQDAPSATLVSTAAHCFPQGGNIFHSNTPGSLGNTYVGTVSQAAPYGSNSDVETIPPLFTNTLIAPNGNVPASIVTNHSSVRTVHGYIPYPGVGVSLCKTGITTGETCGNSVSAVFITVCYANEGNQCFTNMTETSNPNNPSTVLPGDSGGPFYQYYNSSNVEAAGWTSGLEELCDQNGNCAPDGNAFFTPVGNVQQYFNLIPAYYCPQGTLC